MKILLARDVLEARRADLDAAAPGTEWIVIEPDASITGDPEGCEVVFFSIGIERGDPRIMRIFERRSDPSLSWVQGPGAGVEHPVWGSLLDGGVRLTNASGIHAEPIAQYVVGWILSWSQGLPGQVIRSSHHEWTRVVADDLTGQSVGIIGFGGIGAATARITKAIGMTVLASRRTPGPAVNVDEMFTPDRLPDLLSASDYVVVSVPVTDATRGMIDHAAFAAMGSNAVLINVARGAIVDEKALSEALTDRRIRGATLDVVAKEPLPRESPLWDLPNCIITPHQSGYSPLGFERLNDLFIANLDRYVRGEPLLNEVTDTNV